MARQITDVYVLLIGGGKMYAPFWEDLALNQPEVKIAGCPVFVREADSGEVMIFCNEKGDRCPGFDALVAYLQLQKPDSDFAISAHRQHSMPRVYGKIALAEEKILVLKDMEYTLTDVVAGLLSDNLQLNAVVLALAELRKEAPQAIWRTKPNAR